MTDPDEIGPDGRVRLRAHLLSANSLWFAAVCLKQHLRPTGRTQGTQSSLGLLGIVRCSMRLYLHKRQQPSVAGLLSFLDVSSLNSAAPRGAALFLPTLGGRVARPCPTARRTGSIVHTPLYCAVAGTLP